MRSVTQGTAQKTARENKKAGREEEFSPGRLYVAVFRPGSLASSRRALFIFSRAVFCTAPRLTERLEEASRNILS